MGSLENYDFVPLETFIEILGNDRKKIKDLREYIEVLDFLREFRTITKYNIELFSQYNALVKSLILHLNYSLFFEKKKILLKELELSKLKNKSNYLLAKTDLLDKLDKSISKNKKSLKYLEEDYLKRKNQTQQVKLSIDNYNSEIREFNILKKECFSQINRITREFDDSHQKSKSDEISLNLEKNISLKSDRIKALRQKAKDYQYKINQTKSVLSKTQLKLKELNPRYEQLNSSYKKMFNSIKYDEKRYESIKMEIGQILKEEQNLKLKGIHVKDLKMTKPTEEIEAEIIKVEKKLNTILESQAFIDKKNHKNLSFLHNRLEEIKKEFEEKKDKITITTENDKIFTSIQKFRILESFFSELEQLLNKFLILVNLKCSFRIVPSDKRDNFTCKVAFIRSDKKQIIFEELTTPEKTFFVIVLNISLKILSNLKFITFSNLFMHSKFNKKGSIFRTIRKIIPIFEKEQNLRKFHLIFIISNFEIKEPVDNLQIITIKED